MPSTILVVDDDPVQRRLVEAALTRFGHRALTADSGEAGLKTLEAEASQIAVVILDLVMPGMDGIAVLTAMRERGFEVPVIVQTAQGGIDTAVMAMRHGAFDFVVKPASPDRLNKAITDAIKVETVGDEVKRKQPKSGTLSLRDMVTTSPAMERVMRLAEKAAASNIPVLIEGESGVGKEMIARVIQGSSERRARPFVTVNCGAIPDNLVESILFGHEKGSFTGANEKHTGKFVEAHTGTLFLDEIGDLPIDVQVKLLRAVQEGEVDPVGGRGTVKVDIRLVSATHRDLIEQVKLGRFREDLFYRLNVFPIMVPPLRDRKEDIPALVRHFIGKNGRSVGEARLSVTPTALAMLQEYDWPGNIRQLENAVFRASVLRDGDTLGEDEFPQIKAQLRGVSMPVSAQASVATAPSVERSVEQLHEPAPTVVAHVPPPAVAGQISGLDDKGNVRPLSAVEQEMIEMAIAHYSGQMSEVARRLGIGRSTLYRKLKEYGIETDEGEDSPGTTSSAA